MFRFARYGIIACALTASSAYAAAPGAVVAAVSGACGALAVCCGLPCCAGMAM